MTSRSSSVVIAILNIAVSSIAIVVGISSSGVVIVVVVVSCDLHGVFSLLLFRYRTSRHQHHALNSGNNRSRDCTTSRNNMPNLTVHGIAYFNSYLKKAVLKSLAVKPL